MDFKNFNPAAPAARQQPAPPHGRLNRSVSQKAAGDVTLTAEELAEMEQEMVKSKTKVMAWFTKSESEGAPINAPPPAASPFEEVGGLETPPMGKKGLPPRRGDAPPHGKPPAPQDLRKCATRVFSSQHVPEWVGKGDSGAFKRSQSCREMGQSGSVLRSRSVEGPGVMYRPSGAGGAGGAGGALGTGSPYDGVGRRPGMPGGPGGNKDLAKVLSRTEQAAEKVKMLLSRPPDRRLTRSLSAMKKNDRVNLGVGGMGPAGGMGGNYSPGHAGAYGYAGEGSSGGGGGGGRGGMGGMAARPRGDLHLRRAFSEDRRALNSAPMPARGSFAPPGGGVGARRGEDPRQRILAPRGLGHSGDNSPSRSPARPLGGAATSAPRQQYRDEDGRASQGYDDYSRSPSPDWRGRGGGRGGGRVGSTGLRRNGYDEVERGRGGCDDDSRSGSSYDDYDGGRRRRDDEYEGGGRRRDDGDDGDRRRRDDVYDGGGRRGDEYDGGGRRIDDDYDDRRRDDDYDDRRRDDDYDDRRRDDDYDGGRRRRDDVDGYDPRGPGRDTRRRMGRRNGGREMSGREGTGDEGMEVGEMGEEGLWVERMGEEGMGGGGMEGAGWREREEWRENGVYVEGDYVEGDYNEREMGRDRHGHEYDDGYGEEEQEGVREMRGGGEEMGMEGVREEEEQEEGDGEEEEGEGEGRYDADPQGRGDYGYRRGDGSGYHNDVTAELAQDPHDHPDDVAGDYNEQYDNAYGSGGGGEGDAGGGDYCEKHGDADDSPYDGDGYVVAQDGYHQDGYQPDGYQQQHDGYHQDGYHQDGYHQEGYAAVDDGCDDGGGYHSNHNTPSRHATASHPSPQYSSSPHHRSASYSPQQPPSANSHQNSPAVFSPQQSSHHSFQLQTASYSSGSPAAAGSPGLGGVVSGAGGNSAPGGGAMPGRSSTAATGRSPIGHTRSNSQSLPVTRGHVSPGGGRGDAAGAAAPLPGASPARRSRWRNIIGRPLESFAARFELTGEVLGKGYFGDVVVCVERDSGEHFACKVINKGNVKVRAGGMTMVLGKGYFGDVVVCVERDSGEHFACKVINKGNVKVRAGGMTMVLGKGYFGDVVVCVERDSGEHFACKVINKGNVKVRAGGMTMVLGKGYFGDVVVCVERDSGEHFACKVINKANVKVCSGGWGAAWCSAVQCVELTGEVLGKGYFGDVVVCVERDSGEHFACKVINKANVKVCSGRWGAAWCSAVQCVELTGEVLGKGYFGDVVVCVERDSGEHFACKVINKANVKVCSGRLGAAWCSAVQCVELTVEALGKGCFGDVVVCVERDSGEHFACKVINDGGTPEDAEDVQNEVAALEALRGHRHIVQLIETVEEPETVYLVMELCQGGTLQQAVREQGPFTEPQAAAVVAAAAEALLQCHTNGIIHRDVKPDNVLLGERLDVSGGGVPGDVKICDFGISTFFQPGTTCSEIVGTASFLSPEMLAQTYSSPTDIWSLGVLLHLLLSGFLPFRAPTKEAVFEAILDGRVDFRAAPWPIVSLAAKDLVSRMLTVDPDERITAEEILNHPWILDP
ncbi:unnamed protein product [Closterium sp. Yama58-4]|nr:unnamed protein product [Closterium sp. Yama58-4]